MHSNPTSNKPVSPADCALRADSSCEAKCADRRAINTAAPARPQCSQSRPGYRTAYSINPDILALNRTDTSGNPTGGSVELIIPYRNRPVPAIQIYWQDGPRGKGTNPDGSPTLGDPNGAFVEDVLYAALQRLEFFNESKYRDRANSLAITHIEQALQALKDRTLERSYRGVEGKHEV